MQRRRRRVGKALAVEGVQHGLTACTAALGWWLAVIRTSKSTYLSGRGGAGRIGTEDTTKRSRGRQ
jgi:hypothetical protein